MNSGSKGLNSKVIDGEGIYCGKRTIDVGNWGKLAGKKKGDAQGPDRSVAGKLGGCLNSWGPSNRDCRK